MSPPRNRVPQTRMSKQAEVRRDMIRLPEIRLAENGRREESDFAVRRRRHSITWQHENGRIREALRRPYSNPVLQWTSRQNSVSLENRLRAVQQVWKPPLPAAGRISPCLVVMGLLYLRCNVHFADHGSAVASCPGEKGGGSKKTEKIRTAPSRLPGRCHRRGSGSAASRAGC